MTERWLREGIRLAGGERLVLVAWEVMAPSWRINDAHRGFGEPAIDFLAVDAGGGPVAIELKLRVTGPLATWRAACQLTHMTLALARSCREDFFERVSAACRSGDYGRHVESPTEAPAAHPEQGWRRVLAAPVIDAAQVARCAARLGLDDPPGRARDWLRTRPASKADLMVVRLAQEPCPPSGCLRDPVLALQVSEL